MNDYHIMLLRLRCRREDKAFAPLVSFTFIVIAFPYKRTRRKKKDKKTVTSMGYELRGSSVMQTKRSFATLILEFFVRSHALFFESVRDGSVVKTAYLRFVSHPYKEHVLSHLTLYSRKTQVLRILCFDKDTDSLEEHKCVCHDENTGVDSATSRDRAILYVHRVNIFLAIRISSRL